MTQGPSGLHQLSDSEIRTPGVMGIHGPHSVFEVMAAPPHPTPYALRMCAVCMGRVQVYHVLAHLTPSGPCPFLHPGEKVMADDEFTQDLFRFLQLLCEGHNNGEKEGWVEWRGSEVWGQSGRVA